MRGSSAKRRRIRLVAYSTLAVLLAFGAVFRILGAFYMRHSQNPDFGIVALMAKHMADGRDFPLFFYGQPYMGSLEPAISALLCRLFGFSGFVVCLGTALVGFLLLPMVYRWGREAGGHVAGVVALAYCAIGPGGYFHYQSSPRGGYAITLLLGVAIIWHSVNIVFRERNGLSTAGWSWFALGLMAGVGWWSNQLISPALATAAVLFPIGLGLRVFTWKLLPAFLGFLLGSAPLWIWNAMNDWATFSFLDSIGKGSFSHNFRAYFMEKLPAILDFDKGPKMWRMFAGAVYGGTGMATIILFGKNTFERGLTRANLHIAGALLYTLILGLFFSSSQYATLNTARYLLPIVPAMAVLLGIATRGYPKLLFMIAGAAFAPMSGWLATRLSLMSSFPRNQAVIIGVASAIVVGIGLLVLFKKWPRCAKFAPLIGLILWQADNVRYFRDMGKAHDGWVENEGRDFTATLRENNVNAIYTVYVDHCFNYLFNEEFCFSDLKGERYAPYADILENSDDAAVLNDYGRIDSFLAAAGGSATICGTNRPYVFAHFKPPERGFKEISPAAWKAAADSSGTGVMATVSDRNAATRWRSGHSKERKKWIRICFERPTEITKVRLLSDRGRYPNTWRVEGRVAEGEAWRDLTVHLPFLEFYWCGPRVYYGGKMFRLECLFEPATVSQLRVWLGGEDDRRETEISEIQVFGPDKAPVLEKAALPELMDLLKERRIKTLFADRWAANKVRKASGGAIAAPYEPAIVRMSPPESNICVRLDQRTALLTRSEDAPASRQALAACGIAMRETGVGPWTVFDIPADQWRQSYGDDYALYWAGFGCFLGGNEKQRALTLLKRAESIHAKEGATPEAMRLAEEAMRAYPGLRAGVEALARWRRELGQTEEAEQLKARAARMLTPQTPLKAVFDRGIELIGVDAPQQGLKPGGSGKIRLYWRCSPKTKNDRLVVFTHFLSNGAIVFQDDHLLLAHEDIDRQPFPEVFVEERTVDAPQEAEPGEYAMEIGLYDQAAPGRRLSVSTSLPSRHRAVRLPVAIKIERMSVR